MSGIQALQALFETESSSDQTEEAICNTLKQVGKLPSQLPQDTKAPKS